MYLLHPDADLGIIREVSTNDGQSLFLTPSSMGISYPQWKPWPTTDESFDKINNTVALSTGSCGRDKIILSKYEIIVSFLQWLVSSHPIIHIEMIPLWCRPQSSEPRIFIEQVPCDISYASYKLQPCYDLTVSA
jgi:hypothetical protein